MSEMMKECMKPHSLMHMVTGVGLGFLLAGWIGGSLMTWGWVLLVVGLLGDMWVQKKGK